MRYFGKSFIVTLSLLLPAAFAAPSFAAGSPVGDVALTVTVANAPILLDGDGQPVDAPAFDLDLVSANRLRMNGGGTIHLDLPGRGDVAIVLERTDILAPGGGVFVTGPDGPERVPVDLTVFHGHIEGDDKAWGVLSISGSTLMGSITADDGAWAVLPPALLEGQTHHRVVDESKLPSPLANLLCGVKDDPESWIDLPPATSKGVSITSSTRLICNVAVDCDYDFFALFGGIL